MRLISGEFAGSAISLVPNLRFRLRVFDVKM